MNYERLSDMYLWLERLSFGASLRRARLRHLDYLETVRHALLVGEGNGSFLLPFVRQFPESRITVVDESPAMLERARERLRRAGQLSDRIEFVHADATIRQWPRECYDLVVTQFFFDNFDQNQVEQMIRQIAMATTGGAQWLIADFQIPPAGWRCWRAKIWMWGLYGFFGRLATVPVRALPETNAVFSAVGFEPYQHSTLCGGLLFSTLRRMAIS